MNGTLITNLIIYLKIFLEISYWLMDGSKPWAYLVANCYLDMQQKHDVTSYIIIQIKKVGTKCCKKHRVLRRCKACLIINQH